MKLRKNEISILKVLISSNAYLSSYDIATATGINRRIIREEMPKIKRILHKLGFELISKPSKGYLINDKSPYAIKNLQFIVENAEQKQENRIPTLPLERQNYILRRIIDFGDYLKLDDIADELLVSRSTISNDLKQCKVKLDKYNLKLIHKPNYGVTILGKEEDKRKHLCDCLFSNLSESNMHYDYLNSFLSNDDSLEYGIINILRKNNIEFSDIALCDFLLTLSVTISRVFSGHHIIENSDLSPILGRNEFNVAKEIVEFINENIQCPLTQEEINQIAIEIICKRSSKGSNPTKNKSIINIADEILHTIYEQTLIQLDNKHFYNSFVIYVENALLRIHFKEKIRNPLYDVLKTAYPLPYYLAEITSSVIQKHTHHFISSSELAFFSVMFNNAILTKHHEKYKVLLLSGFGSVSENWIASQILDKFGEKIDINKKIQYYNLSLENLKNYDFIISTLPIHQDFSIPHINISQIIKNEDLDKIGDYLNFQSNTIQLETLFNPLFFMYNDTTNITCSIIANEIYKMLSKQLPNITEFIKNNFFSKENEYYIHKNSQIALINMSKSFHNSPIISSIIIKNSILINDVSIKLVIIVSEFGNNSIYQLLKNILKSLVLHPKDIQYIFEYPTYINLLKTFTKYKDLL